MIYPLESKKFIVEFDKSKVEEILRSKKFYRSEESFLRELYDLKMSSFEYHLLKPNYEGRYLNAKFMSLSCKSRQYLLKDNYYDFDIVASQPNVMMSLFKKNKLDCPKLANYCLRRDKKLNSIIDCFKLTDSIIHKGLIDEKEYTAKAKAKELFNSMLNLGTFEGWANKFNINISDVETTYFDDFQAEMKQNITKLSMIEKTLYLQISKKCKLENKTNVLGCFASAMYKKYERLLLESLLESFPEIYGIYAFDGVMINKQSLEVEQIDEFLSAFKQITIDKFGEEFNNVIMITKEMNDPWDIKVDELPPLEINEIKKINQKSKIFTSVSGQADYNFEAGLTTGEISDYFKIKYTNFVYSNKQLYFYDSIYWKKDNDKHAYLNNHIDKNVFIDLFTQFQIYEKNMLQKMLKDDTIDSKSQNDKLDVIRKTIISLRNFKSREPYIKDIICKITNEDLKFDENPYLFAFTNKVYDLKEMKFQEQSNPLDYISMTCGYDYNDNYDLQNKTEVKDLFKSIHKNKNIHNYHLTALATGLLGIPIEKFIVLTGTGGNGKSLIDDFMLETVGEFGYLMPTILLTQPLKAGSNPELANCNKKRFIVAQEAKESDNIVSGNVKSLTGGTKINARMNYSNDCDTIIDATWFFECNKTPNFDTVGSAELRRLETIKFNSNFVDVSIYDPNDNSMDGVMNPIYKTKEWKNNHRQGFFEFLLEFLPSFYLNGLVSPPEVLEQNKLYLEKSDRIFSTINEFYEKTDDVKDVIKMKDIYASFTNSSYYSNLNKKDKREINYKSFQAKLESNIFLKKYIGVNNHNGAILTNHIVRQVECEIFDEEPPNHLGFYKEKDL